MNKSFCVLPWIHLATHPNGGVSLCCRSNHTNAISWARNKNDDSLLTLDNNKIREIMNSDKFVEVRQMMLDGKRPVECEGCWQDEDRGIKSKRQYENERWSSLIPDLDKTARIENVRLIYVELRLGNVCNNACLTCNSYSSTKWYPDEKKISKELSWFKLRPMENFRWFENSEFYEDLANHSEYAQEIYINGGEPTLIKQHFKYLSDLIKTGTSKNVHLVYSLNLMDVPDELIELWKSFKKVTVNASIDDVGDRNYYIRYPTKWNEVKTSIDKLNSCDIIDWHVTQTISILNVKNLHELNDWLRKTYNKIPHHNYVLYPDYLSLSALPDIYKSELLAFYQDKLPEYQVVELSAKLQTEHKPELSKKAREFIDAVDRARNLDYTNYLPELKEIL